jgi:hypothetical protein
MGRLKTTFHTDRQRIETSDDGARWLLAQVATAPHEAAASAAKTIELGIGSHVSLTQSEKEALLSARLDDSDIARAPVADYDSLIQLRYELTRDTGQQAY